MKSVSRLYIFEWCAASGKQCVMRIVRRAHRMHLQCWYKNIMAITINNLITNAERKFDTACSYALAADRHTRYSI